MASLALRLATAGVALGVTLAAHARIPIPSVVDRSTPAAPGTDRLADLTLGFDALLADYWWLRAVQAVGHEKADLVAAAPSIGSLVDRVVALDPFVDHPYRFAALWLVNDPDQVRAANRILERGIAYHPDDWRNRFYLSFNHFFYLGDAEASARELGPAIELDGAPKYLGRLKARLESQHGGLDAAAAYLQELLQQTEDGFKRAEYEKALDEIETERRARLLDQARAAFRARTGRDIRSVEELASGPDAVLRALPPDLHGWGWVLDPDSGEIESAYYGHRYQLHMHAVDRQRLEQWSGASTPEATKEDEG